MLARADSLDREGNASDTFTIQIILSQGRHFQVTGELKTRSGIAEERLKLLPLMSNRPRIQTAFRCIEVKIPNWGRSNVAGKFKAEDVIATLNATMFENAKTNPQAYCRAQRAALAAETEYAENVLKELDRRSVAVQVRRHQEAHLQGRLYVILQRPPGPHWALEAQQTIWLSPSRNQNPNGAGIFDDEPPSVPGADEARWTAKTVMVGNQLRAVIQNVGNGIDQVKVDNMIRNTTIVRLDVRMSLEDPTIGRHNKAINLLKDIFEQEANGRGAYNLQLTPIYMENNPGQNNIAAFQKFQGQGVEDWQTHRRERYQLRQNSHVNAISQVFTAIIEGPPATGKTTAVGKVINVAYRHYDLGGGRIVCAAHTNEAVRVAADRTISQMNSNNFDTGNPLDLVCIYTTRAKSEYMRMSEQDLGPLQQYSVDAHMKRIVDAALEADWHGFRDGLAEIERTSRIENTGMRNRYMAQRRDLIGQVRAKCKIFFATLASCHDEDAMFGYDNFKCALLIIDEASQAIDPAVYTAHIALNPRRILFIGDPKQLSPYVMSPVAIRTNGRSLLEKIPLKQNASAVRLDMQYRTAPNIYAGTNYHYTTGPRTELQSADSTRGRPNLQLLLQNIKRISFTDAKGKKHPLSWNVHFFDCTNSVTHAVGPTQSAANTIEKDFARGRGSLPHSRGYHSRYDHDIDGV